MSIINHTTTCPYCGHRVLPQNLKKHMQAIHPDKEWEAEFTNSLKKTESSKWWREASQMDEAVPLADVFLEVVKEPDPPRHTWDTRKPAAGQKPTQKKSKPTKQTQCEICGIQIYAPDLEKHKTRHVFGQPYRDEEEIHCPVCSLNIHYGNLETHLKVIHKISSGVSIIKKQVLADEYYCLQDVHPVETEFGTLNVTRRGWVECPQCTTMIHFGSLKKHMRKVHHQDG